jgi:hypothetical protein
MGLRGTAPEQADLPDDDGLMVVIDFECDEEGRKERDPTIAES